MVSGDSLEAIEALHARGVTDGLPVVPPTPQRVADFVEVSGRDADHLVALVPPNFGRATFEKIAINAVMAGCRPEHMPVVVAAVEAVCDEAFDLHIGRALRLVCVNVGGARPGAISMSTLAHPGRYTYCIGEHAEVSPWESLAVEHGFAPDDSTVALLAADAPLGVYDQRSRRAEDLLATIAPSLGVVANHKMTHWGDTLLVLGPEHAQIVAGDGWRKADVRLPVRTVAAAGARADPRAGRRRGPAEHVLRKFPHPETDATLIPKFRSPDNIKIVVAGGTAGRFSAIVPGWTFSKGSQLVFRRLS